MSTSDSPGTTLASILVVDDDQTLRNLLEYNLRREGYRVLAADGNEPPLKPLIDIPRMGEVAREMLHESLAAFAERDMAAAQQVAERDDVDQLYNQIYRELLTFMMADPSTIDRATHLLWVAHNLERIADRVTNICERVVFLVTGKMAEMKATSDHGLDEDRSSAS